VSTGSSLFSFISETSKFTFSSFGITEYSLDGKFIQTETFPIFVGTIALVLLSFLCLMSYKNINRQFKLGRLVFFIYFLSLLSIFLLSVFGDRLLDVSSSSREMGVGYYLFIAGFPFSFLANIGIKRDKKLLDSLDRLR
jgi:DMSO/TMAO reductase YedYZ heme-binding membrane subunit